MTEQAPPTRRRDEYGRAVFSQHEVPDPLHPDSRFAQWLRRTCGPWVVLGGFSDAKHSLYCFKGWISSGEWWFVCRRCHPDAVDKPATAEHQHRSTDGADSRRESAVGHPRSNHV